MKEAILSAAMQLANLKGYKRITRAEIAAKADVAPGLVSYHFKDMKGMRDAMVERAVQSENLKVLGQALADAHPVARKAPETLRKAAVLKMVG